MAADLDTPPSEPVEQGSESTDWSSWGNLWQIPAILISAVLITLGIIVAGERSPDFDYDAALDQVDQLLTADRLDDAGQSLNEVIEPILPEATQLQQARFHALAADWVAAVQDAGDGTTSANNQQIDALYARAVELGQTLVPRQVERWAIALIDLGRIKDARARLDELEVLAVTETYGEEATLRQSRLLKRMVQLSLNKPAAPIDELLAVLEEYRLNPMISPVDDAWAIAREIELELSRGDADYAGRRLHIEMRRHEDANPPLPAAAWGELYTLLGRAEFMKGRYDHATFYLDEAMNRFEGAESARSQTLLYLARIDVARGEHDAAFARFDEIVRDYETTSASLPGLLARAEVRSILGDHEASLADYESLRNVLRKSAARRDVTPRVAAASLADRHDAALAIGDLPLALRYVSVAESLFPASDVPVDVLFRIASTSRQIADNMLAGAREDEFGRSLPIEDIDPKLRYDASKHLERAGEFYLRHARALTSVAGADEQWSTSLWLSGDSFDLAGRRERAITFFREYVEGRPIDDPRRSEVMFRLAQALQADMQFDEAANVYAQLIEEHPRSTHGTASHVPLARCDLAMNRKQEAEQRLLGVLEGRSPVTPDAIDYRDALIELGTLYHTAGEFPKAIERLTVTLERYPDDPRVNEVRFRLADSYRRLALATRAALEADPRVSPAERTAGESQATLNLSKALELFDEVVQDYVSRDPDRLNSLQREFLRHASLNRGDCAYELGRYDIAARLYDQAASRYSSHHSSMNALVQIINCFDRLGDMSRADVAHRNALLRLDQLPPGAFDDPQSIMDRAAWERWLENRPLGKVQLSDAGTS